MSPKTTPSAAMVAAMVRGLTGAEPLIGSWAGWLMESYSHWQVLGGNQSQSGCAGACFFALKSHLLSFPFPAFHTIRTMNTIQTIINQGLAQAQGAAPAGADQQSGGWTILAMYALLFVGMYFLLFAPQRKRQKELEKLQSDLAVGDKVLAAGGIYGRVVSIKEDRITLELDSGRLVVHKSAIMGKDADAIVKA